MENKCLDELSIKELELILDSASEIINVLNEHFDMGTIMNDDLLMRLYINNINTSNVCFAQLKKIFKNNPDSIYSKL